MLNAVKPVFFFFRNGRVYADYSLFYCTTQNTTKAVVSQLQVTVLTNIPLSREMYYGHYKARHEIGVSPLGHISTQPFMTDQC